MEQGKVFDELALSISRKERSDLYKKVAERNTVEKTGTSAVLGNEKTGNAIQQRNEYKKLPFFKKIILSIAAFLHGQSVLTYIEKQHLHRIIRQLQSNRPSFVTRRAPYLISKNFGYQVLNLYRKLAPARGVLSNMMKKEDFFIDFFKENVLSKPSLAPKLDGVKSFFHPEEIERLINERKSIKNYRNSIRKRIVAYVQSLPDSIFSSLVSSFRYFLTFQRIVNYPYTRLLSSFGDFDTRNPNPTLKDIHSRGFAPYIDPLYELYVTYDPQLRLEEQLRNIVKKTLQKEANEQKDTIDARSLEIRMKILNQAIKEWESFIRNTPFVPFLKFIRNDSRYTPPQPQKDTQDSLILKRAATKAIIDMLMDDVIQKLGKEMSRQYRLALLKYAPDSEEATIPNYNNRRFSYLKDYKECMEFSYEESLLTLRKFALGFYSKNTRPLLMIMLKKVIPASIKYHDMLKNITADIDKFNEKVEALNTLLSFQGSLGKEISEISGFFNVNDTVAVPKHNKLIHKIDTLVKKLIEEYLSSINDLCQYLKMFDKIEFSSLFPKLAIKVENNLFSGQSIRNIITASLKDLTTFHYLFSVYANTQLTGSQNIVKINTGAQPAGSSVPFAPKERVQNDDKPSLQPPSTKNPLAVNAQ